MTRRERLLGVVALLLLSGNPSCSVAHAYDAARPGTPRAQIVGGGNLDGWTLTLGGVALCDSLDVRTYDRTIECEFDEEE